MKFVIIFVIFGFNCLNLIAEDTVKTSSPAVYEVFWDDIKSAGNDFYEIGASIGRIDGDDLLRAGIYTGITAALFSVDRPARDYFQEIRTAESDDFFKIGDDMGRIAYAEMFSGGIYLTGLFSGCEDIRETGRLMFEALAVSGTAVMAMRIGFGRARPYMEEGVTKFKFMQFTEDYQSFPSGHTTVAFSMATVLAHQVDRWWGWPLFFGIASITPLSRLNYDQHFISDVFMGALVGIGGAYAVIYANDRNNESKAQSLSISVYPVGVNFCYKF